MRETELFIGVDIGINTGGIGVLDGEPAGPVRAYSTAGEFEEKPNKYEKFVRYTEGIPDWLIEGITDFRSSLDFPRVYVVIEDFNYMGKTTTTAVVMNRIIGSCYRSLHEQTTGDGDTSPCFDDIICPPVENSIWEPALGVRGMTREQRTKILPNILNIKKPVETTSPDGPNEHEEDALMIAQWLRDSVRLLSRTGIRPEDIPAAIRTTRKI